MWASLIVQLVKNLPAMQETWVRFLVGKILWRRKWQPTPVFLPGESDGQKRLAGYSPWGRKNRTQLSDLTTTRALCMGPSQDRQPPWLRCPLSASCLQKTFSFLGFPQVPKNKFNERREKMWKQENTQARPKKKNLAIKQRIFSSSSRAINNILSHILWAVLQILKPPPGGKS